MKKLILTAAAAMMVLASCTKTKVESIDGPKEIAFKKIEGAMTKEPLTLDQMNDGTMGVYAINHATPTTYYFENAKFGYNSPAGAWVGLNNNGDHTPHYWPLNGQALDFVVYAPHMSTEGNTKIGYTSKTLEFIIENNSASQTDYLYGAEYFNNQTGAGGNGYTNPKNDTPIGVNLKHALAKITVNVNANLDNVFTITEIILNNTEQGGTITVVYDENDAAVTSCEATSEGTTDGDIEMTLLDSDTPISVNVNVNQNTTKTCLVFPGDATNKRLQTSLKITYKMKGLDTDLTTTLNLQTDPLNPSTWDYGKHYIYNLTLTANEIQFNPTVADWDDTVVKNKNITEDGNVNL